MDIQEVVRKLMLDLEKVELNSVEEELDKIIAKIKKQKNVKLFYELLIKLNMKRLLNILTERKCCLDKYEKEFLKSKVHIELEKQSLIEEKYHRFTEIYVEEKITDSSSFKISSQNPKGDFCTNQILEREISTEELLENNVLKIAMINMINLLNSSCSLSDIDICNSDIYYKSFEYFFDKKDEDEELFDDTVDDDEYLRVKKDNHLSCKKELPLEYYYILDNLKSKISHYEKGSSDRKFMKAIYKKFSSIKEICEIERNQKDREKVYFDIVNFLLQNQENYLFIRELIKRIPRISNINYIDKETKECNHIIFYILELYMGTEKTKNSNNSKRRRYLKEVYLLFTKSSNFKISYECRKKLDDTINKYKVELDNVIKSSRIAKKLKKEIDEMSTNSFYSTKYSQLIDFNIDSLTYHRQRVLNLTKERADSLLSRETTIQKIEHKCLIEATEIWNRELSKKYANIDTSLKNNIIRSMRDDLLKSINIDSIEFPKSIEAFIVGDRSYSFDKKENNLVLKMHSLDYSPYITEKSVLETYLMQCEIDKNTADDIISKPFRLKVDDNYPVITYCLEFFPSGVLKSLSIEKNIIHINSEYKTAYTKDDKLTAFLDLYQKSVNKSGGIFTSYDIYNMGKHFDNIFIKSYIDFLRDLNLPFIYYGYSKPTEDSINDIRNNISSKLHLLSKEDSSEILDIISHNDHSHYSIAQIENGVYELDLVNGFNYISLENQRMLNTFYFNSMDIEDTNKIQQLKNKYYNSYVNTIKCFNETIGYLDQYETQKQKRKVIITRIF